MRLILVVLGTEILDVGSERLQMLLVFLIFQGEHMQRAMGQLTWDPGEFCAVDWAWQLCQYTNSDDWFGLVLGRIARLLGKVDIQVSLNLFQGSQLSFHHLVGCL